MPAPHRLLDHIRAARHDDIRRREHRHLKPMPLLIIPQSTRASDEETASGLSDQCDACFHVKGTQYGLDMVTNRELATTQ